MPRTVQAEDVRRVSALLPLVAVDMLATLARRQLGEYEVARGELGSGSKIKLLATANNWKGQPGIHVWYHPVQGVMDAHLATIEFYGRGEGEFGARFHQGPHIEDEMYVSAIVEPFLDALDTADGRLDRAKALSLRRVYFAADDGRNVVHAGGDEVEILEAFRDSDNVSRLGGERVATYDVSGTSLTTAPDRKRLLGPQFLR